MADSRAALGRRANQDAGTPGWATAETLQAKIEARQPRQLLSAGWQPQREGRGEAPRSLTAPESRAMQRGTGRGTEGCDNVHTAVDSKPKLIRAHAVAHEPGDRDWLSPRALQAKAVRGCPCDAVADVGDDHAAAGKTGLEAGISPSRARPIVLLSLLRPNAGRQARREAGARHERTLEVVRSRPLLGGRVTRGRRSHRTPALAPRR
jgi:hypothetical protein